MPDAVALRVNSPEEMYEILKPRDGESTDDLLSLYDAMGRYGISRTALRNACRSGKVPHQWVGGVSRKMLVARREDIVNYILLPQSVAGRAPWRVNDLRPANVGS